jgi:hypothetical protein
LESESRTKQNWMTVERFGMGDRVRAFRPGAGIGLGATGVVSSIKTVGCVNRYAVEFRDGQTETFFGFELRHEDIDEAPDSRPVPRVVRRTSVIPGARVR